MGRAEVPRNGNVINLLVVEPEYRKRGIGSELLQRIENDVRVNAFGTVQVQTSSENERWLERRVYQKRKGVVSSFWIGLKNGTTHYKDLFS